MTGNTNPPDQSQVQPEKSSVKKPKRRLDHMRDLADGFDKFDMVPRKLSRAYIDGKFPESKFRLMLCMLSHSDGFHVKRSYLDERFSDKTLAKYLPELQVEGYIEVEVLPCPTGGTMKLYHVRSAEDWAIYRHPADPSLSGVRKTVDPSLSGASLSGVHKETKGKESKKSEFKTPPEFQTPVEEPIPPISDMPIKQKPAARQARSGVFKVTKSLLYGELGQLYEGTTKRDVIRAAVAQMLEIMGGDLEAVRQVIAREQEKDRDRLLWWGPNAAKGWKDLAKTALMSKTEYAK